MANAAKNKLLQSDQFASEVRRSRMEMDGRYEDGVSSLMGEGMPGDTQPFAQRRMARECRNDKRALEGTKARDRADFGDGGDGEKAEEARGLMKHGWLV
jgi:hypothetical protein